MIKFLYIDNILSGINILGIVGTLYLLEFPNKRFIPMNLFFNLFAHIFFYVINLRHLFCNYDRYLQEFFRFHLTLNIYLSSHIVFIYFLSFICNEKCSTDEDKYLYVGTLTSLLTLCFSAITKHRETENNSYVYPTNLREIVVQPTPTQQLEDFLNKVKGEVKNKDIKEKDEIVKSIIEDMIFRVFDKKNEEICTICLTSLSQYQKIVILQCNHTYHTGCLYDCYKNKLLNCSLCRARIIV